MTELDTNINYFSELLDQMDLLDEFKIIYSDGGITWKNKLKLIEVMRSKRKVCADLKKIIYFEQDFKCALCSRKTVNIDIDHIRPLFMGGSNDRSNLQGLCKDCHATKCATERINIDIYIEKTYKTYFSEIKKTKENKIQTMSTTDIFLHSDVNDQMKQKSLKTSEILKSKYFCKICKTIFISQSSYWSHINRNKYACITKERCLELINELKYKEEQIKNQNGEFMRNQREIDELNKEILLNDNMILQLKHRIEIKEKYLSRYELYIRNLV